MNKAEQDNAAYQSFLEKLKKYIKILELEKQEEQMLEDYEQLCQSGVEFDDKSETIKTMTKIKQNIEQRKKQEQANYPDYKDYQISRDKIIKDAYEAFF